MTDENNNFKMKSADWQGYMRRAVEDMGQDVKEIRKSIDDLNKQMTRIKVKVAGIGASVSLITTILILLIRELVTR